MQLSVFNQLLGIWQAVISPLTTTSNSSQKSQRINALEQVLNQWQEACRQQSYQTAIPFPCWEVLTSNTPTSHLFFYRLLIIALWHYENPLGFRDDLSRFTEPTLNSNVDVLPQTPIDQGMVMVWQQLLTWTLSERFVPRQLPKLLRAQNLWEFPTLDKAAQQLLEQGLFSLADILEQRGTVLPAAGFSSPSVAESLYWGIGQWAIAPDQPRLVAEQRPKPTDDWDIGLLCALALSGAFDSFRVIQTAFPPPPPSLSQAIGSWVNQFFQLWSGQTTESVNTVGVISAPQVMQRRSSLKLISQTEYVQFIRALEE